MFLVAACNENVSDYYGDWFVFFHTAELALEKRLFIDFRNVLPFLKPILLVS